MCPVDVWYSPYVTLQRGFVALTLNGPAEKAVIVPVRDIMRGLCKRGQFIHPAP